MGLQGFTIPYASGPQFWPCGLRTTRENLEPENSWQEISNSLVEGLRVAMGFIVKSAVAVVASFVLFVGMQVLLGTTPCCDRGARAGFPFAYVQSGTYGTLGHMIWSGFAVDYAIALVAAIIATSVAWRWFVSRRGSR